MTSKLGDDVWRSSNSGVYSVFFNDTGGSLLNKFQIKATTGPNQTGTVLFDWTDLATSINLSSYTTPWSLTGSLWNLLSNGTNYISVRVYDNAGNYSTQSDVFYIRKDITPPIIYDNQPGDDVWRSENTALYNVDFEDSGGSLLNRFEIKITTGQNMSGTIVVDWTIIGSNLNSNLYTSNWQISDSLFNLLPTGTNYVSVRVYDNAQNVSISTDVFYILKDTMPVSVINNEAPSHYTVWLNTNSLYYNIDAQSNISPLDRIEIAISTQGYNILPYFINWTVAVASINANTYTDDWRIPDSVFDALLSGTTNYVSVRVYNQAGKKTTLSDGFKIFKDTITPIYQNNITNEYTWTNSSTTLYDVDIIDLGGSGVFGFEVLASTNTNGNFPLTSWILAVSTPINQQSYTSNWSLPQSVFSSLFENTTNYISLKIYDVAHNTITFYDAFKVFKDTTTPTITDNQPGDDVWRSSNSGVYSVFFNDVGGSLLSKFQLKATSGPNQTGTVLFDWTDLATSINLSSYTTPWSLTGSLWDLLSSGTNYISVRVYDNAGNYTSQSDVFYIRKDTVPPASVILTAPVSNSSTNITNITFSWQGLTDGHSGVKGYELYISTKEDFSVVVGSSYVVGLSKAFLLDGGRYYWRVRAVDNADNFGSWSDVWSVLIDTVSPTIVDNQPGDDVWRSSNSGVYSVFFNDVGGSLLNKFQLKATSGPNQTGTVLFDWTDLATSINLSSYTMPWSLTGSLWDLLSNGTNYISVRVYDNAGNVSISTDVFYILKDTIPPNIVDNQSGIDEWYKLDPGSIFDVDFYDYHSKLSTPTYYSYTQPNKAGVLISSGDISGVFGLVSYTSNWGVDFDKLQQGYNYITVIVRDIAGNTTEYLDVFYIKKDTSPPIIEDLQNGDTNWYNLNPGNIFNVNFYDYGIGITTVSIKVTTGPNQTGTILIDGSTFYSSNPTPQINKFGFTDLQWSLLINGTNYLSLYAYDGLGNLSVSTDVFYIQKDTVPPSPITTLNSTTSLNQVDEGSIYISWVATGDDGNFGNAKSYLIRYATYPINSSNFDTASVYNSTLVPKSAGSLESLRMSGLFPGTTYYIAIKASDKAGNISLVSNTTSTYATPDLTPPAAITDLNAIPGDFTGQIKIRWTARGEGTAGVEGTNAVSGYIVKYATYSINSSNFNSAQTYSQTWIAKSPGEVEEYTLEGLEPEVTYYIAIRSYDEVNNISNISNTTSTYAAPKGPRDAVILYSKSGSSTLKYRKYSSLTSSWSSELDTGISFSGTVRWIVLKSVPVIRDVMVAGVLDSNNVLKFLKYDGVSDSWSDITPTPSPAPGNSLYRNFDIAVEQNSGRVLIVYYNGTAGRVSYAVWSSTSNSWVITPTSLAMASLTGQIYWVRTKPMTGTNRIGLAVLDANSDISAAIWNGSLWIDNVNLTLSAAIATEEDFDIAWESLTGDLLAVWGTGTTTNYRKWYSTGTWGGTLAGPNIANTANWIRLCSSPLSNRIGFTSLGGLNYWHVAVWRPGGSEGWSTLPTADTAMSANDKRITDCAWQSKTERLLIIAVDDLGTYDNQFDWITWSNGTWNPASPSVATPNTNTTFSDNIKWTSLLNDPDTDNIMAWAVDTLNNLRSTAWNGSSWAANGTNVNFYHGVVQDYNYESFAIEFKRKDNIPPTLIDSQIGDDVWRNSNYQTYSVFANDTGGSLLKEIQTKIYTGPSGSGILVEDWTPQVSSINSSSYSQWKLSEATFNRLPQGTTNYVWVRAVDNAGNISSVVIDAFYVKKDTTPPTITSNISTTSFNFWTSTGVGLINIDFSDYGGSKLSSATYTVYTSTGLSGTKVVENVLISSAINKDVCDVDWSINFLLLSNGTNYVSVSVWDNAGSSSTYIDAFKVLKDTIPPSTVSNLSAIPGPTLGTVLLSFTAPFDDQNSGNNTQGGYIIKYATFAITQDALFELATTYNETFVPKDAGQTENIVIYGLDENTTYYFALKSYDKANNLSAISNSPSTMPQKSNVFINEIYPSGSSGGDWIELYNNTSQSFNLENWKITYKQGPLNSNASEVVVWVGSSSDVILSGGFKLINLSFDLNSALSYSVILKNSANKVVDQLQWKPLSAAQSYSRIYDGSKYFEIDITPTPGYANSITTHPVRINEISYKNYEFVELYSSTTVDLSLINWSLRNKNAYLFRFTTNISSYSFVAFDTTSFSLDNYGWYDAFGGVGLDENGDFVVLENSAGQTIDRVSWAGSYIPLYDYKASTTSASYAPSYSNTSISRFPDYKDSDDDGVDFVLSASPTPFSRNTNSGLLGAVEVVYPSSSVWLPYNFTFKLKLNNDYNDGENDIVVFIDKTGLDTHSPHIFKLRSIGLNLSNTSTQTVYLNFDTFTDINGYKLKNGCEYKVLFTLDSSTASSQNLWLDGVKVDTKPIDVFVSTTPWVYLVPENDIDIMSFSISNNTGYGVYITSISIVFKSTDNVVLSTDDLKSLASEIKIIRDSEVGEKGVFEKSIDSNVIVSISNNNFILNNGRLDIAISSQQFSYTPQASTSTYFVIFVASSTAYNYHKNMIYAEVYPDYVRVSDSYNLLSQPKNIVSYIKTSTLSFVNISSSPSQIWVYETARISNITTMASIDYYNYTHLYITANDGYLRAVDYTNGYEKWSFNANSPIKTSALVSLGPNDQTYLYFATESGYLYKLEDKGTYATTVWSTYLGSGVIAGELFDSDTKLYFGSSDSKIRCVEKSNGALCSGWIYDSGIDAPVSSALSVDFRTDVNTGWAGLLNGKVVAFSLSDGSIRNSFNASSSVYSAPFVDSAYAQESNNIFIVSSDGKLYSRIASNLTTKPQNWNDVTLSASSYSSPWKVIGSSVVIVGDESGRIYKIDSVNGSILATFNANWPIRKMPFEWGGTVYFAAGKYLFAVDYNTFTLKSGYPLYLGSEVKNEFSVDIEYGYLTFSTNDGKVYFVDLW